MARRKDQQATYRRLLAVLDPPRECDLPADKWTLQGEERSRAIADFLEWFAQREALSALGRATAGYPIEEFAAECRKRVAAKRTENTGYYRNTKAGSRGRVRNRQGQFT